MQNTLFMKSWGKTYKVDGGPFAKWDERSIGVNLAGGQVASRIPPTIEIDWPDFGVPEEEQVRTVLRLVIPWIMSRQKVYIGCLGGRGRTGTMLALIAKCFGYRDPIGDVRWSFNPHAVETEEQEQFVESFDVTEFRRQVFMHGFRNWRAGLDKDLSAY